MQALILHICPCNSCMQQAGNKVSVMLLPLVAAAYALLLLACKVVGLSADLCK